MIFVADHARNSMYRAGFQPALKIDDIEVWVHTDRGLYASLWWVGTNPTEAFVMQSEHVRFMLDGYKRVEAVLEPGVMRMYVSPEHQIWKTDNHKEEDEDCGDEADKTR